MLAVIRPCRHGLLKRLRNLGPAIVFVATSILMAVSIAGTVVVLLFYLMQDSDASVRTSKILTLLSSTVSFIFVGLYLLAARRNEPVSKERPPTSPLHGACFIVMRITTLLWIATMIVVLGTTFNLEGCEEIGGICLLQRVDMIISILAIPTTIAILLGLETCDKPFKTPSALNIQHRIVCRISYFDEIWKHGESCRSSLSTMVEQGGTCETFSLRNKKTLISDGYEPIPRKFSDASTVSEDLEHLDKHLFHSGRPHPSHISGNVERSLTYLQSNCRLPSQSGGSTSGNTMICQSLRSLGLSVENSASDTFRPSYWPISHRIACPTDSIRSYSSRSPLSNMRIIENPEVSIKADDHICSGIRDSFQQQPSILHCGLNEGASPNTTANIEYWRKRALARVAPLDLRRQTVQSKRIRAGMSARASKLPGQALTAFEGNAVAVSLLGPNLKGGGSKNMESALDVHSRIIEQSIQAAAKRRMQQEPRRREQANPNEACSRGKVNQSNEW